MESNYIKEAGTEKSRRMIYYQCEKCGDRIKAQYRNWIKRTTNGCGECGRKTHGKTKTPLHTKWMGMNRRCSKSYNNPAYEKIFICDEWKDYKNFEKWAFKNGYEKHLTIDRIDSSKNYEPNNCQFITLSENSRKIKHHWSEKFLKMDLCGISEHIYNFSLSHKGKYIGSYKTQKSAINAKKQYIRENNIS